MRLQLRDPVASSDEAGFHLRATLAYAPGTLPSATVGFDVEPAAVAIAEASVLPFVPAALVLACRVGQDLVVHEPLPPAVHAGARHVAGLLARWYGWRPAELIAPLGPEPVRPPVLRRRRGVAVYFTRGVDSWGSVIDRLGGPRRSRPTLLVNAELDVRNDPELHARSLVETRRVADELGLPLAVIRSDVRAALDPHLDWGSEVHGSVFAGMGYLLRATVHEVVISPTHWTPHLRPWGSHPDLDPAWSLPELTVTHHPGDETRWSRAARVAEHPIAARSLEVCWHGSRHRNCGRCDKCLRTMIALELAGHHDTVEACFDAPFSLDAIRPDLIVYPQAWCDTIDNLDHHGLRADPIRQRWEQVDQRGRDGIFFQTRPVQPRLPVAGVDGDRWTEVARPLARLGLRVDHDARPGCDDPALVITSGARGLLASIRTAAGATDPVALRDLALDDLEPLLEAVGASVADAVPFDPDHQPPPPLQHPPDDWPTTASADPPRLG